MGAKRKALVEKFGYDTKNAAHLVRLLHMGHEYLETGRLQVRRGIFDREMLMSIKRGEWSLTLVQAYAQRRLELLQQMKTSVLPETIDEEAINDLVVRCMWKELQ
jgi:glycerol-3-phosphate dehydrogenase